MREFKPQEVKFSMSVEWDLSEIDDDAFDEETRNLICKQIDEENVWAWCVVTVIAEWAGFAGIDSLGGCSYRDKEEFVQPGGYYQDMVSESVHYLIGEIRASGWEIHVPDGSIAAAVDRGFREAAQNCE